MTLPTRRRDTDFSTPTPRGGLDTLTQELARLFDERWPDLPSLTAGVGFTPVADVEETDDAYLIDLELPGVRKDDIDIEVADQRVVISGELRERQRIGLMRRRTRSWGRFYFEVTLPEPIDEERIEAKLHEGVLELRLPKREGQRRRHIDVR